MTVKMGDVWDRTTRFLGDHPGAVSAVAVPLIFVPVAIQGILPPLAGVWPGLRYGLSLLNLLLAAVSLWGQLSVIALVLDAAAPAAARRIALRRLLPAIGIVLLMLAVAALAFAPVLAMLQAKGYDFAAAMGGAMPDMPEGAAGAVLFYAVVYGIVFLLVGARLVPIYAVVVQERPGLGAFARSWRLTRGLTWRIAGVVLLFAIVAGICVMAVQTVFGSVLEIVAGGEGPVTLASLLTPILVAAVSTVLTIVSMVFTAELYRATSAASGRKTAQPA